MIKKTFSIFLLLGFFSLLFTPCLFAQTKIYFGMRTGYQQAYYDALGSSYKSKMQQGFGLNYYLQAKFNKHLGAEFELAGFCHISQSDSKNNYFYPKIIEIPWSVMLKGFLPYRSGNFHAGLGYYFPYILKGSYYWPRKTYSGLVAEAGYDFLSKNSKLSIGPLIKFVSYFDEESDQFFSVYFFLNISCRIF